MNQPSPAMPCPVCHTALVMSERQGIEIDYCPTCRGVWLDRGELDKIIERSAAPVQAPQAAPPPQSAPPPSPPPHSGGWQEPPRYGGDYRGYKPHKRRKSFLEELFD